MKRLLLLLALVVPLVLALAGMALAQPGPEFKLSFKALADQIPEVAGQPVEAEHYGPNGDSLQKTTTGLMVWRKAGNWTAFTDGNRTWINGPRGLQDRGNIERFDWEIAAGPANSASIPSAQWTRLAPQNPMPIRSMAVDPRWPDRQVLLLLRGDDLLGPLAWNSDLLRSSDGGANWERLRPPTPDLFSVTLAPTAGDKPVAFGLSRSSGYRSADLGSSWQGVLEFPLARPGLDVTRPSSYGYTVPSQSPSLILSPDFVKDGLVLALAYGRLHRSDDAGETWHEVDPAAGQWVQQVVFSPDFARDRTVFAATISRPFPGPLFDLDPPTDNERSLGVLVSRDGGSTWTQVSQGLEVKGVPYRHVQLLVVSPTFAQDSTLFAFAWGPRIPWQPGWGVGTALLRSTDRAASWQGVHDFGPYIRPYPQVSLSSDFAADGIGLMALGYSGQSPSMAKSILLRTGDGGASWSSMTSVPTGQGFGPLLLQPDDSQLLTFVSRSGGVVSTDGGLSWIRFGWAPGAFPSPGFVRDKTLFTSTGGILVLGPGTPPASGSLPCPAQIAQDFGKLWNADTSLRDQLGCPLEPERTIRVREGPARSVVFQGGTGYWTEDDLPIWFGIGTSVRLSPGNQDWQEIHSKDREPWPGEPDRVFEAIIQRFEDGLMLRFTKASGGRVILAFPYLRGSWREVPE